ncbi:MAG: DNA translocase FtsK 4TM domain-containing protein, partial [Crocinitomicaceae bacterium]
MVEENEYIEKGEDSEEKATTNKATKKSSSKKSKPKKKSKTIKIPFIEKMKEKLADKKVRTTIGVALVLLSVYMLLANFSYLLTWTADQDRVMGKGLFEFLFDGNEEPVENWLGKFGAWMSHLMMYRWFGVASFSICLILFV